MHNEHNQQISAPGLTRRTFLQTTASAATAAMIGCSPREHRDGKRGIESSPIIDSHMHVWANDPRHYPLQYPYNKEFKKAPCPATLEMLLEDMDRYGCTHAIIVQCIYHGWDNSYVAACLQRAPDRLKVHGLIDPQDPKVADKLEYWVKEHGLHGMRFSPVYYDGDNGGDSWLNAPETHELWRRAEALGVVFNFLIKPGQLPRLGTMAKAHPGVPVIVDHLGGFNLDIDNPETTFHYLTDLARYRNVWVKVSEFSSVTPGTAYPMEGAWPWVKRTYESFGPDRLLWGTGYPGAARACFGRPDLGQEIALIREVIPFLSDEDRAKILGRNAAELWGIA